MKVLITSFKPFNNMINNYSTEVLNYINNQYKIVLDVVYDECYIKLKEQFNLDEFDLIIALGEARSRNVLTLETNAKNISSCSLKDNSDVLKQNELIIKNGKDILETKVDLNLISNIIQLSNDAGKFVCNNLYYHLLNNYPSKSLFIHIPECDNDINKYQEYAKVIEKIILALTK